MRRLSNKQTFFFFIVFSGTNIKYKPETGHKNEIRACIRLLKKNMMHKYKLFRLVDGLGELVPVLMDVQIPPKRWSLRQLPDSLSKICRL